MLSVLSQRSLNRGQLGIKRSDDRWMPSEKSDPLRPGEVRPTAQRVLQNDRGKELSAVKHVNGDDIGRGGRGCAVCGDSL